MDESQADFTLDLSGLLCPLPVLKARKKLAAMTSGEILQVIATDPMAAIDMPHFCGEQGHVLVRRENADGALKFWIKKAP